MDEAADGLRVFSIHTLPVSSAARFAINAATGGHRPVWRPDRPVWAGLSGGGC
jgi:hypothetical protein